MTVAPSPVALDAELDLARRCAHRDEAALRQVITSNNQRLFRAAWSILGDRGEAEEAVQSAYLKAFEKIAEFAGRSSLSTWLTRIAINEALGRLRCAKRRRAALEAQGVTLIDSYREAFMRGSDTPSPDTTLAREQMKQLLERAIAALPDGFRAVFVLREVEGLSVEETSEALDLPPATVKTRFLRARRKLQESLAPEVRGTLDGVFPFAGADCAAMTERVLAVVLKRT